MCREEWCSKGCVSLSGPLAPPPPQTNIELTREEDFAKILELEEEQVRRMCDDIIAMKPDLVISEKGVSDLAQHFLVKHNISCIRRVKKSDNNRVAR